MIRPRGTHCTLSVLGVGTVAVAFLLAVMLEGTRGVALAGPILFVGGTDDRFWALVASIAGAAGLGGALGWGIATLAAPEVMTIALVFGIAIGGGLGALVRVFALGETDPQEPESVTVGSPSDEESSPTPQPADLFEEHPDPVLYFDDAGDGPVVRAVNEAFEETFGVGADAVTNAALADASMATDRVGDLVTAASSGESFDVVLTCETDDEQVEFRLRTAAVTDGTGTRGYVVYTPVEN